jgi:hypothetical protein
MGSLRGSRSRRLRRLGVRVVAGVFGWGFEDEREAVIVERGIVVEVERDVESGRVPLDEVIFPFCASFVLRGDGFFARRVAEIFERVGCGVQEHGNFDELAAIDDEIGGVAVAFGMIEIGGSSGGDFGALALLDGVEKMCAGSPPGIFAAHFYFVAGLALEAQERFDWLADVMAIDFDGRRCRRSLLGHDRVGDGTRERTVGRPGIQTGGRSGDGCETRDECDRHHSRQIESHTHTISRRRGGWLNCFAMSPTYKQRRRSSEPQ